MSPSAIWSRFSIRTKSLLVLSIPLIPLLLAMAAITVTTRQQRAAQRLVEQTLEVKELIAQSLKVTFDAEAAVTDLWLTRDARASERFDAAVRAWPEVTGRLVDAVADNPIQTAHAMDARQLRDDRPLRHLRNYLIDHPTALTPPRELLERSRTALTEIRAKLDEMQRVEDRLLIERGAILHAAETRVLRTTLYGAVLGLIGGVLCSLSFSREVSRRIGEVGDNAFRLVRNQPLRYLRPSQDEIGTLGAQLQQLWGLTAARIQELDRARGELDQFFSVSPDMLCIANAAGRFTRVNPAWTNVLGWSSEELTSRPYLDFVHPDDLERAARESARQAGGTVDIRYRCKDGAYRWLSWKSASHPELGVIFAAARDVTDERGIKAELESRVHELRELNGELEAFTYSVSHDLRAPLRHVSGFNGFIERSALPRLNEQERRWLSQSIEAAERMGRLIDELLAFSKMGRAPIARDRVSLDAIVRDARQEIESTGLDARQIDWCIQPLPEIHGDAAMLRRVFVNLLDNAIKYTRVRARAVIEVGTLPQRQDQAVIFVRDNGVGFDMQYAHKLFGVFQRLHAQEDFEGTGIGLANVRRIIVRHGGQTWAEGTINQGATFFVSLPVGHKSVAA